MVFLSEILNYSLPVFTAVHAQPLAAGNAAQPIMNNYAPLPLGYNIFNNGRHFLRVFQKLRQAQVGKRVFQQT